MVEKFVGIYLEPGCFDPNTGGHEFVYEDVGKTLDFIRDKVKIPNLYFRGYTPSTGAYFTPHAKYYGNTILKEFTEGVGFEPEYDLLEKVIKEAKERNMNTHFYMFPSKETPIGIPNISKALEIDVYGRKGPLPCFNNPDYREWMISVIEDVMRSYDIAGFMWGAERCGPLVNLITWKRIPFCFCPHCRKIGAEMGINPDQGSKGLSGTNGLCA